MRKILTFTIFLVLSSFIFLSCVNEPEIITKKKRTVLVYMIASNSLGINNYDAKDIKEMETGMSKYTKNDCRLLVYYVPYNADPYLFEIVKNKNQVSRKIKKTYSRDIKSTTSQRMGEVINDLAKLAPADDYGLVLWSHSDGWARSLGQGRSRNHMIQSAANSGAYFLTRDFGEDSGSTMPVDELADVIPAGMFSFIYTDACYMGSIEIAYQLRNKTKYFIGSCALLPADGMPYDKNIPHFFEDEPNLTNACIETFDYYNNQSGAYRTNTISLIDCTKLNELAIICRRIHENEKSADISSIQQYTYDIPQNIYFDFKQYTSQISSPELIPEFENIIKEVVLYKAATPYIFGTLAIDPQKFSGVSTYILGRGNTLNENYYKTLDWYNDVYL